MADIHTEVKLILGKTDSDVAAKIDAWLAARDPVAFRTAELEIAALGREVADAITAMRNRERGGSDGTVPQHNCGRPCRPENRRRRDPQPTAVKVHDFRGRRVTKAIPYGVYDLGTNAGWVSVGIDHDTPAFAVQTIRTWWRQMGRRAYPNARELLITADCGGSNGYRPRAWKVELQGLADETALRISVSHFPPGTSKWNKIEHRMFCHITQNWRGRPLVSQEVIVSLIGHTTTKTGLTIKAQLDGATYPKSVKVTDDVLATLRLTPAHFRGEWNYKIAPH